MFKTGVCHSVISNSYFWLCLISILFLPMTLFLLLLVTVTLIVIVVLVIKIKSKDRDLAIAKTAIEQQTLATAARESQLQGEVEQLSQYLPILDAEQYANEVRTLAESEAATVLASARREANDLRTAAADELKQARTESKEIRDQAGVKARVLQTQADGVLLDATREAARIITMANQRAEEIAGEALAAPVMQPALRRPSKPLKMSLTVTATST